MRVVANIRLCGIKDGTTTNLGGSSDQFNQRSHDKPLDPGNVVSEKITLTRPWCEVVDDNVGLR